MRTKRTSWFYPGCYRGFIYYSITKYFVMLLTTVLTEACTINSLIYGAD